MKLVYAVEMQWRLGITYFFECSYSTQIWEKLVRGLMKRRYTDRCELITSILTDSGLDHISTFYIRYSFQCTIHITWWERNKRRHGDTPKYMVTMGKQIDKTIRNRLHLLSRSEDTRYKESLGVWFGSR